MCTARNKVGTDIKVIEIIVTGMLCALAYDIYQNYLLIFSVVDKKLFFVKPPTSDWDWLFKNNRRQISVEPYLTIPNMFK